MVSEKDLSLESPKIPDFEALESAFEAALQKPERAPMGFREKLIHATKRFYGRMTNRFLGIEESDEYDTGQTLIPSRGGKKYQFEHIKDGIRESQTTVLSHARRSGDDILATDIQSISFPDEEHPKKKILQSRHDLVTSRGTQTEVVTDGVSMPDGESLSKTRNFETGETTFRRHKGGLFQEWTFNETHRLISSYEGRFGEAGKPDVMRQFSYDYASTGSLLSAVETRTTITPDGETVQRINHPLSENLNQRTPQKDFSR